MSDVKDQVRHDLLAARRDLPSCRGGNNLLNDSGNVVAKESADQPNGLGVRLAHRRGVRLAEVREDGSPNGEPLVAFAVGLLYSVGELCSLVRCDAFWVAEPGRASACLQSHMLGLISLLLKFDTADETKKWLEMPANEMLLDVPNPRESKARALVVFHRVQLVVWTGKSPWLARVGELGLFPDPGVSLISIFVVFPLSARRLAFDPRRLVLRGAGTRSEIGCGPRSHFCW